MSNYTEKELENICHVKYENIYYIDSKFYYFTTEQNIKKKIKKIKTLGGPEHTNKINENEYIFFPIIKNFKDKNDLKKYVNIIENLKEITEPTIYVSHYYEHNIGHGLYDTLYPLYLCYLNFYKNCDNDKINIFLNILKVNSWKMPQNYLPTREWVLNVFKDFCNGGEIYKKKEIKNNIKFKVFLVGSNKAGISSTNKNGVMPGKTINAIEKFRDRFYKIYNIIKIKKEKLNIIIIDSHRYSKVEKSNLLKIVEYYNKEYNINYINWKDIPNFKEQLQIISETDIHISGCGTSMMNFLFLKDNSVHINLGTGYYGSKKISTLMETNICLLSNKIYCDFYNIYDYNEILYEKLKINIDKNASNLKNKIFLKTKVPYYTLKWRELCKNESFNKIIDRMNNIEKPNLISIRFPDIFLKMIYNK
jgi:hypothetical protein